MPVPELGFDPQSRVGRLYEDIKTEYLKKNPAKTEEDLRRELNTGY